VADRRVPGERFAFDEDVWAEEVGRFTATGRAHASAGAARAQIERRGASIAVRPCESEGADGTLLAGCAKVYVPIDVEPSLAPYGFVFVIRAETLGGRVLLRLVAYGPPTPARPLPRPVRRAEGDAAFSAAPADAVLAPRARAPVLTGTRSEDPGERHVGESLARGHEVARSSIRRRLRRRGARESSPNSR
jgi:hypothetical protein